MSRSSAQKSAGGGEAPRHWVWVGGPVPPGAAAITIGPVISVRRGAAENQRLMRHELVHVRQWRELGVVGFLRRYVAAYLRWRVRGYPHWGGLNPESYPLGSDGPKCADALLAADGRAWQPLR